MDQESELQRAAARLATARSVVVLTGAGVSAESRIPTFRDTMEGLWSKFDPRTLATPEAFDADPETVTRWYDWRRVACLAAEPNAGHRAIAAIERALRARDGTCVVLTQNVDRLHQRAGSADVVELHGTIMEWRCTATGRRHALPDGAMETFPPPSPFRDGALLRPDVVWFGERLPEAALDRADAACDDCDVFIVAGTSSVVYPAAGYTDHARTRGAFTIEVNPEETAASARVDAVLRGPGGTMLPRLVARAFGDEVD